ncbi:MAG: ATP-dependent DNA helicase [Armatimonadota bacterium]
MFDELEQLFNHVTSRLPGYEYRPQQIQMARAVFQSLISGAHAVIEAGTGCGKTMAYLVPLLAEGKKAVVSTGTIALQTQLVEKDLVFLSQVFPRPFRFAIAKGRANYLCPQKLLEAERSLPPNDPNLEIVADVREIWESGSWNGDVANLPFTVPQALWVQELANNHEECSGSKCLFYSSCPFLRAKRLWEEADIVVANHALYFMHIATGGAVLPYHDVVVFDEAHHLEDAAHSALGVEIGRFALTYLLRRAARRLGNIPPNIQNSLLQADQALLDWVDRQGWRTSRITYPQGLDEIAKSFIAALGDLEQWIKRAEVDRFQLLAETAELARAEAEAHREALLVQTTGLKHRWEHFAHIEDSLDSHVTWLEADQPRQYFQLVSSPLYVGDILSEKLWPNTPSILTSATLAVSHSFDYIIHRLGLPSDSLVCGMFDSPFNFEEQAVLYLPRGLPDPNDPSYNAQIVPVIEEILHCSSGRAFVLFTSYRSLREVYSALRQRIPFPSKSQEDLPKGALLDWFKSTPNSVLFATSSFWEGVDVTGQALSCVIIDRLPFTHPDDPIHQANVDAMKAAGEDWFYGYALPKAVLTLKQGFGRLIRTRKDRGIVAILDPRVTTKAYGRAILASLPPARVVRELDRDFLQAWLDEAENGAVQPAG